MIESLTKTLTAGTLGTGVAMLVGVIIATFTSPAAQPTTPVAAAAGDSPAAAAATAEQATPLLRVATTKPELAALLIALAMFLGHLTLLQRDRKEDRRDAKESQTNCHAFGKEMQGKLAEVTSSALVKMEQCAVDRDMLLATVDKNTEATDALTQAIKQLGHP